MNASQIVIAAFLVGAAAFAADKPPAWPLHEAVKANDAAALQQALAATPDVNVRDDSGDKATALFLAAEAGHVDLARLLLDKGANPEAGGSLGRTPLMAAARNGHLPVMELLVSRGASIECAGHETGWTCLKSAAYGQQLAAVKWLVEKGAKLHARGEDGDNALADAAIRPGNAAVVRYLLEQGADFRSPNKHGFAPLWRAEASKDSEIIALIQDRLGGRTTTTSAAAAPAAASSSQAATNASEVMAYSCDILAASVEMVIGTFEQHRDGRVFPCKYMENISTILQRTRRQIAHAAANDRCDLTQEDANAYVAAHFDESLEAGLANCSQ